MARAPKPPRAFQRMLSGRRLDLLDPSPLDVEIEDIAHGLARVARWNGMAWFSFAAGPATSCVWLQALPNGDLIASGETFATVGSLASFIEERAG